MKILIIEDEKKIAELIEHRLRQENYEVTLSNDGQEGLYQALSDLYDLIILDIMLPFIDGFEILNEIQKNHIHSKVIMLSARSELEDKIATLTHGAIDYLTKPFYLEELVVRVNLQLKQAINIKDELLTFNDLSLDYRKSCINHIPSNKQIEVSAKELSILECLFKNPNQITSKAYLYDYVWGLDNDSMSNTLEAFISFIRKKLKALDSNVNIKAVRGLGYKLEVNDE